MSDLAGLEHDARTTGLSVQWIHGSESSKHNTDPDIQVFWYDDDTVILRQNKAINYEAPFLYLLFGTSGQCYSIPAPQPHPVFPAAANRGFADGELARAQSTPRVPPDGVAHPFPRRSCCRRQPVP